MNEITQKRNDYYASIGTPPGPATSKGIYGEAEVTGHYASEINGVLGNYDLPTNWPQPVMHNAPGDVPGAPVMYGPAQTPDEIGAGYGYQDAEAKPETDIFYYHSDHLGSTNYITDNESNATQFVCYMPYGETLVDEHTTAPDPAYLTAYKFNGKEMDAETGLYYYGARYYEPELAMWYGVDALAEKYASMGAYVYCANNPVKLVDPDGRKIVVHDKESQNSILKTLPTELRNYISFSKDGTLNIAECEKFECSDSYNAYSLYVLYTDENTINFYTAQCVDDGNGNTYNLVGDDDNGIKGITLMPSIEESLSPDSEIHVYTSSNLSPYRKARNTAHEGYGHALSYIWGEDPMHRYEGTFIDLGNGEWAIGRKDANEQLTQRINTAENETQSYF